MQHEFKQGHALIIVGPQGSGKSEMAREIAADAFHSTMETTMQDLIDGKGAHIGKVRRSKAEVVIVDELDGGEIHMAVAKALVVNERKNFIFLSNTRKPFWETTCRRFTVVRAGKRG